jgi:hypothetical protein
MSADHRLIRHSPYQTAARQPCFRGDPTKPGGCSRIARRARPTLAGRSDVWLECAAWIICRANTAQKPPQRIVASAADAAFAPAVAYTRIFCQTMQPTPMASTSFARVRFAIPTRFSRTIRCPSPVTQTRQIGRFRFSIRDMLWLTVIVALGVGWCVDLTRAGVAE